MLKIFYDKFQYAYLGSYSIVVLSFPFVVIAALIYWFVRRAWHKSKFGFDFKKIRRKCVLNEIVRLLLVIWIAEIIAIVVLPVDFWETIWRTLAGYENVPVLETSREPFSYNFSLVPSLFYCITGEQAVNLRIMLMQTGNILLFVPFGAALPFIRKHTSFLITTLSGLAVSVVIECVQPFIYGRSGDIDDIICNTLGTVVGYILYLLIKKLFPKFAEKCGTNAPKKPKIDFYKKT